MAHCSFVLTCGFATGHTFEYAAVIANSSWYGEDSNEYSHEGAGEPDSAMLQDGTVVTVMRFDAGMLAIQHYSAAVLRHQRRGTHGSVIQY